MVGGSPGKDDVMGASLESQTMRHNAVYVCDGVRAETLPKNSMQKES